MWKPSHIRPPQLLFMSSIKTMHSRLPYLDTYNGFDHSSIISYPGLSSSRTYHRLPLGSGLGKDVGKWHKIANDMRVNLVRQGLINKMRYPALYKHRDQKYNWNDRNTWPYCWVHDMQGQHRSACNDWYRCSIQNQSGSPRTH